MGKYYDKLLEINESLTKELKDKGLFNEDGDKIEISPDALSDEQKQDMLLDNGVDKEVVNGLEGDELNAALATSMNTDETKAKKNESNEDVSEEVVIRMDDDNLDLHGFVKAYDGKEDIELVDDGSDAEVFQHEELGQNIIEAICSKFHYNPSAFKTVSIDPRADEPYEDDEPDNEPMDESDGADEGGFYLRMDDDDLDIHGYVKWDIEEKAEFVDDEKDADVFDTTADAKAIILDICDKFNYDPETFSIQHRDSQIDDTENWISLDPMDGTATTLGG